ncbi:kinase-like protein [Rhizophagus irregularis]|uniref:Kinase-like protein n=1 Tax=Rhizophagus irregularis TaxID=588596 RepID=A0A2N1MUM0_9GLOM|nr:kinase-like protein [Rhizophagus irregularis]
MKYYDKNRYYKLSGNNVVDDVIIISCEGGFSKIYKAIWVEKHNNKCKTIALKKLNNSKDITPKDLNELKMFYDYHSRSSEIFGINEYFNFHNVCIINYYGITQDPTTKDFMIIMDYYSSGDLRHYITNHFYYSWYKKLIMLISILSGLKYIHDANIIHRDFHSGNILYNNATSAIICDLGISKSSIAADNSGEIYGIIPYIAPEIFQGHKYTTASDIYSFGMIMWEFMTGRRPFWDQNYDIDLIISICEGLRPPITTIIPKDYINLMKKCWHSDPNKRPTASSILKELDYIKLSELEKPTKIKLSPEIGPITTNNPGAIYTSRTLSNMIKPAIYTSMSQEAQSLELDPFNYYYQNNNYTSFNELELDINNKRSDKYDNYIIHETKEWELDINNIKSDEYHNYIIYNKYLDNLAKLKVLELVINNILTLLSYIFWLTLIVCNKYPGNLTKEWQFYIDNIRSNLYTFRSTLVIHNKCMYSMQKNIAHVLKLKQNSNYNWRNNDRRKLLTLLKALLESNFLFGYYNRKIHWCIHCINKIICHFNQSFLFWILLESYILFDYNAETEVHWCIHSINKIICHFNQSFLFWILLGSNILFDYIAETEVHWCIHTFLFGILLGSNILSDYIAETEVHWCIHKKSTVLIA